MIERLAELAKVAQGERWTVQRTSITGYSLLVRGDDGHLTASTQLPTGICEHIAAFHNAAPLLIAVAEAAEKVYNDHRRGMEADDPCRCRVCLVIGPTIRALKETKP